MLKKISLILVSVLLLFCVGSSAYLLLFGAKDGADGANGLNGVDGKDGSNGLDGAFWYIEEGEPAASLGKAGDCYFDPKSDTVYQKSANGWEIVGTLRPSADEDTVEITFDANEGTLSGQANSFTLGKGSSAALPTPAREGYDFLGWYYGEGVNAGRADNLTVFTKDVTLTARWRKKNTIVLRENEKQETVGGTVRYGGRYDGKVGTAIEVFLERDGVRLKRYAAEEAGWIGYSEHNEDKDQTGEFEGYMQFLESGDYKIVFRAEEDGFVTEAEMRVTIA